MVEKADACVTQARKIAMPFMLIMSYSKRGTEERREEGKLIPVVMIF